MSLVVTSEVKFNQLMFLKVKKSASGFNLATLASTSNSKEDLYSLVCKYKLVNCL